MTKRNALNLVAFTAVTVALIVFLSTLFLPRSDSVWNNCETAKDLYQQPRDSIQVAVIGTSSVSTGISPNKLYEDYGISSFVFGTGHQPLLASFYLLREIHSLNPNSLSTVILDPSSVELTSKDADIPASSERALAQLRLSPIKIRAALECQKQYEDFSAVEFLISVLKYHDRWTNLKDIDYEFIFDSSDNFYSHGQNLLFDMDIDMYDEDEQYYPDWSITKSQDYPEEELEALFPKKNRTDLKRIINYCNNESLNLVFAKLPKKGWGDEEHDAIQKIASENGIPYIDFNEPQVLEEIGYVFPIDTSQNHATVHGMQKLTSYIGDYLAEHYEFEDVRQDSLHAFMESDIARYSLDVEDGDLQTCATLEEYLDLIDKDRYTVFIATQGEAADGLTDEARRRFADLGLENLSNLSRGQSYVGIIDAGEVRSDAVADSLDKAVKVKGSYKDYRVNIDTQQLSKKATVPDSFTIISEGSEAGKSSSMEFDETELSEGRTGINFIVFNRDTRRLIDTSSFNTHEGSHRSSDIVPDAYYDKLEERRVSATG